MRVTSWVFQIILLLIIHCKAKQKCMWNVLKTTLFSKKQFPGLHDSSRIYLWVYYLSMARYVTVIKYKKICQFICCFNLSELLKMYLCQALSSLTVCAHLCKPPYLQNNTIYAVPKHAHIAFRTWGKVYPNMAW